MNEFGTWKRSSSTYVKVSGMSYEQEVSASFVRTATSTTVDKLYQNVTLERGKTYTLSAYVRVDDGVSFTTTGGVSLSFQSSTGATTYASSELLNYSTQDVGDGWLRLFVNYAVPESETSATLSARAYITATGYQGTIYVDAVQMEEASAASTYNLVENGSFEGGADLRTGEDNTWYKQGTSQIVTDNTALFGTHSATLTGDANNRVMQRYLVDFPIESTFILSGWGKANADPNGVNEKTETDDAFFGLILHFYYSDGNDDVFYYAFDPYYDGWQYTQGIAVPKSATDNAKITKIYIAAAYDHNFGTAYMDNISLRMEPAQTYTYDDEGNPITTEAAGAGETNATYDGVDLMEYTAANGSKINYTYNDAHDILTATSDGVTSTYTYNSVGNVTQSVMTDGTLRMQSSAAYSDDGDHTTRVRDANNQLVEYAYDPVDESLTSTSVKVTDANGNEVAKSTTEYTYDNAGRTTKTTLKDPTNTLASVDYTYLGGQLSALTRTSYRNGAEQTQTYGFTYNDWGQSISISVGNTTLATYEYESNGGNLSKMTYGNDEDAANHNSVSYSYDNLDRLSKTVYNDTGRYIEYAYNAESVLAKLTYRESSGTQIAAYLFEYDSLGRLIRSTEYGANNTITQRTEHLYDEFNRLSSQSWVVQGDSFTESYIYNDPDVGRDDLGAPQDGSLKQMTTATGDTINYNYDGLKRLQSTAIKNSGGTTLFRTGYSYKAGAATNQTTNRISVYTTWNPDYTALYSYRYEYDEVGNITQIKDAKNSNRVLAMYTYDVQNQLRSERIYTYAANNTTTSPNAIDVYSYTYDTAGNIQAEYKNGVAVKTYAYDNGDWNDLLASVNGSAISYDEIGNPEVYRNGELTSDNTPITYYMDWEQGRQLSYLEIWGEDQSQVVYAYDLDGIRTQKTVDNVVHKYVTQNGKVVRETVGTGANAKILDFIYDASGKPFALQYTDGTAETKTYYYILNLQGDVVELVEYTQVLSLYRMNTVATYTYNAWGEILTATGEMASINPLRYRGYYYDAETGFYYLQSRYYDPTMHRFINADSLASTGQGITGTNMFAYCRNCPVLRIDTAGSYDRDAAIEYAREWHDDANTDDYYEYSSDCANFASQCLEAGGIKMSDGWYSKRTSKSFFSKLIDPKAWFYKRFRYNWNISESWRLADEQYKYFSDRNNGYTEKAVIKIFSPQFIPANVHCENIQKGDLLYFSHDGKTAYHAAIISKVEGGMIYYAAHTKSQFDCRLSDTMGDNIVFIVRISDDA